MLKRFWQWLLLYISGNSTTVRWTFCSTLLTLSLAMFGVALALSADINVLSTSGSRVFFVAGLVVLAAVIGLGLYYITHVLQDHTPGRVVEIQNALTQANIRIAELKTSIDALRYDLTKQKKPD